MIEKKNNDTGPNKPVRAVIVYFRDCRAIGRETEKKFEEMRFSNLIIAKMLCHQSLLGKGNSFACRQACSGASYDYKGILRYGLHDLKLDEAVGLFNFLVKSRPFPSIIEFNKLLSAIAKMKKYDVVISLGEQMQRLGILHDRYTYNILINSFCRSSQLPFALASIGKMIKLGYV